jgi:hypothetical protein
MSGRHHPLGLFYVHEMPSVQILRGVFVTGCANPCGLKRTIPQVLIEIARVSPQLCVLVSHVPWLWLGTIAGQDFAPQNAKRGWKKR